MFMEILAVVLFIIILVVIVTIKNSVNNNLSALRREIRQIKDELLKQHNAPSTHTVTAPEIPASTPTINVPPVPAKEKQYWETGFKPALTEEEQQEKLQVKEEWLRLKEQAEKEKIENAKTAASINTPVSTPVPTVMAPPPISKPGFFEKHPDLEKFIGENLVSKIGIAVLVLAIGFFVKYAIDNNWIGEVGRVAIGITCGSILIGLAHRLRMNYKAFSSVLVGGGIAVFYFTIALAYHQFHLFGQIPAFIVMIVITAFAVALALLYDRQELAIIALIGGFVTPFLVSTGSGNYKTLFSYLLVLNMGLLVIAYNKAWRLLNILAFAFTSLLFILWVITSINFGGTTEYPVSRYRDGLLFGTAFYLLFFFINVANNIKEQKRFVASDFTILLVNTALYFAAGLYFLTAMHASAYRGLFCVSIGVFNLAASYFLLRKQKVDANVLYLLVGITLTFISLAAPVQLHGNHITLFWASECVLLYWLYQRSGIAIIRWASLLVWACMVISLLMDWVNTYSFNTTSLAIVFNKAFMTSLGAAIASYALFLLKQKPVPEAGARAFPPAVTFRIAALTILFFGGAFEINHQFQYYYPSTAINLLYILLYTFLFVFIFVAISNSMKSLRTGWFIPVSMIAICSLLYLVAIPEYYVVLSTMMETKTHLVHYAAHWVSALLIGGLFYMLIKMIQKNVQSGHNRQPLTWVLAAWIVIFLSVETNLLSNRVFFNAGASWARLNDVFLRTGLPILWGLCSFAFMWLGMRYKFRPLRIISLTLFSVTLLKLFVFDIRDIPVGGKIAAFFCLGVLLLIVSFMYQRLKRIIIEDEEKAIK
jgi:uncharacterized membrane protein